MIKKYVQLNNFLDYILLLFSLIIIVGTSVYYIYALNTVGIIITLIIVLILFYYLPKKRKPLSVIKINKIDKRSKTLLISYLILFIFSILILFSNQSNASLSSPWEVVNKFFFILYTLLTINLILSFYTKLPLKIKLVLVSLHYFLSFIIANIVYKIYYGFDPIIHQAAMEFINKNGVITPKTPYYIGEYSLIIILHKLSTISISILNKLLVPVLAAIFIPRTIYKFLRKYYQDRNSILITIISLLTITFSPFITTTPQNLSYIFLILTIFYTLRNKTIWSIILALSTLAIHPLTGIPTVIFVIFSIILRYKKEIKRKFIYLSLLIANSLAIPGALLLSNNNHWNNNFYFISLFTKIYSHIGSAGQENVILNFVYFFHNNLPLIITLLIIGSILISYKNKFRQPLLLLILISLGINYILISQINFHDVINYEQSSYANRMLTLIILFSLPYLSFSIQAMMAKATKQNKQVKLIYLIILALLVTTSLYISYPRVDKYFHSKSYSISIDDVKAVHWIDNNSQNTEYIVLANQQVGVTALKEFGFDHYYTSPYGKLYYYSIPTGNKLYQYYLEMVHKTPTRQIAKEAMNLVGVNKVYLVVNKYWYRSDRLIGEAKLNSNSYHKINNTYIFEYHN